MASLTSVTVQSRSRTLWLAWFFYLCLALIVTALAAYGHFPPGDVRAARAVQEAHGVPLLPALSDALYYIGHWPASLVVALGALLVASLRGNPIGGAFILLTMLVRPIGTLIKEVVQRPRPSEDLVSVVEGAPGFSFPSGHVFGTVLLAGFIAFLLVERQQSPVRRFLVMIVVGTIIVAMAVQRVYAGAHWPTDSLAGVLWGGLVLFVLLQAYSATSRYWLVGNRRRAYTRQRLFQ